MFFRSKPKVPSIDAETLKEWLDQNKDVILLDVRTEQEWKQTGVIPGSLMVPNFKVAAEMQNGLNLDKGKPVVTICRTGSRSQRVAEYLHDQDIEAINLQNGISGWYRNNYQVERV